MNPAALIRNVSLARPEALYLLAVAAVVLGWSLLSLGQVRKLAAPLMRAAALSLFVLALAGPAKVTSSRSAARPVMADASASITPAMREWEAGLLSAKLGLHPGDPAAVFAASSVETSVGGAAAMLKGVEGCKACNPGATDLEGVLTRLAAAPYGRGGPVALLTDGWQNRGDAVRAVAPLVAAGIRLYIFTPPGDAAMPNVAMTGLLLPAALSRAAPFALGVTMDNFNRTAVAGAIRVYRDGTLAAERKVTLAPGEQRLDFPIHSEATGLESYEAVFKPDDPALDRYPEDDSLKGWVGVGARRKVLILSASRKDANYLETAVRGMGLEPAAVTVGSGQWNGSLAGYDAVVLNNLPSARLAPAAQSALARYVEHGGALAMTGGDESFGLGGYQSSPVGNVMPVVMKPPEHKERSRALVLLIDKSGSMGRNDKLTYAKAAAKTVTRSLKPTDLLGVIGFDSQPFVAVPLEPLAQSRPYLDGMIDRLKAQGRTYLLPALEEAERALARSGAPIKHVVILTDGETGGTADMYYSLVSAMHHDQGATISTIAIGRHPNLALLEAISKYGGGAFYQTDRPSNLPEIFLADVKRHGGETTMVEQEFLPHIVVPDPVLRDLAGRSLPPLKGYVATELKPRASLDMFVNRGGRRDPVIASWNYGAGKALAVTTDASGRWSGPWITGNAFAPVWNRLISWMTPASAAEQKVEVALGYDLGRIRIKLTDYGERSGPGPHPVTALVTRPDASKAETALFEEVPGELSGSIEAPHPGTYYLEIKSREFKDQPFPPLAYTVSPAVTAELPRPAPNYGLLEHLASATGGRLNPLPAEVGLTRAAIERRVSLNRQVVVAAMLLLIAEALVRRLTM